MLYTTQKPTTIISLLQGNFLHGNYHSTGLTACFFMQLQLQQATHKPHYSCIQDPTLISLFLS